MKVSRRVLIPFDDGSSLAPVLTATILGKASHLAPAWNLTKILLIVQPVDYSPYRLRRSCFTHISYEKDNIKKRKACFVLRRNIMPV